MGLLMRAFELVRFYAKLLDKRQIVQVRVARWEVGLQTKLNQTVRQIIYTFFVNPARSSLRGFGSLLTQDINSWLVLFLFRCCLYFRLQPTRTILSSTLLLMLLILWNIQDQFIETFPFSRCLSVMSTAKPRTHYIWYLYFCLDFLFAIQSSR